MVMEPSRGGTASKQCMAIDPCGKQAVDGDGDGTFARQYSERAADGNGIFSQ
jgi:hypothetical protein